MAVLLAAAAALLFGVLAVAIRVALRTAPDPDAGSQVTTLVACCVCVVVAVAFGEWRRTPWHETWPFFVAGVVTPGISQLLFTRAVDLIGPSRTTMLVGISPVLSAGIAIALLGEPVRAALVIGTLLVVAGGAMLAWERGGWRGLLSLGTGLGTLAAVLFSARDNFIRWAERGNAVPGVVAAACSLAAATAAIFVVVAFQGGLLRRAQRAARPFLAGGLAYGGAYACLLAAFERGRVTVVTPLYATESLWAVVISAVVLPRTERIGLRLVSAALLIVAGGALIGGFR
jgi:drug/metabolite transporter (DMT)-like permease